MVKVLARNFSMMWCVFSTQKIGSGLAQTAIVGEHSKHAVKMLKMMGRLNTAFAPEDESILIFGQGWHQTKTPTDWFRGEDQARESQFHHVRAGSQGQHPQRCVYYLMAAQSGAPYCRGFHKGHFDLYRRSVVRVQFKSNGVFPRRAELHCIIDEILKTASAEILRPERNWTEGRDPTSLFRLNATGESEIRDVLIGMGASTRQLGPHPMHGHVIDFRNVSKDVLANGCKGTSMALSDVPAPLERLPASFFGSPSGPEASRGDMGRAVSAAAAGL